MGSDATPGASSCTNSVEPVTISKATFARNPAKKIATTMRSRPRCSNMMRTAASANSAESMPERPRYVAISGMAV